MKTEEEERRQSNTEDRKTPTPQLTSTKGMISSSTGERGQEQLPALIRAHSLRPAAHQCRRRTKPPFPGLSASPLWHSS